jgi:hypothetical protein
VIEDQRIALMQLIVRLPDDALKPVEDWLCQPFAPWATMPHDFVFPHELVDTFLAPADTLKLGDACELCGLRVPVYTFGKCGDEPAFPRCPRCGSKTTQAANHATGPRPLTREDVK